MIKHVLYVGMWQPTAAAASSALLYLIDWSRSHILHPEQSRTDSLISFQCVLAAEHLTRTFMPRSIICYLYLYLRFICENHYLDLQSGTFSIQIMMAIFPFTFRNIRHGLTVNLHLKKVNGCQENIKMCQVYEFVISCHFFLISYFVHNWNEGLKKDKYKFRNGHISND